MFNPNGQIIAGLLVRHFHSGKRLKATIVATPYQGNKVAVGIARANKNDRPSRAVGREIALERLLRGLNLPHANDKHIDPEEYKQLKKTEASRKLFVVLPSAELEQLIENNSFAKWGTPFGTEPDQRRAYLAKANVQGKKDRARAEREKQARLKKAEQHQKKAAVERTKRIQEAKKQTIKLLSSGF